MSTTEHPTQPSAARLIRAAIAAAGRGPAVAKALGITTAAVNNWAMNGRIPADRIKPLCDMGHNIVTPVQILDALSRESGRPA